MVIFSKMLARGLSQTATQITSTIQADLHNQGARIEAIEQKVELTVAKANQNTACMEDLQDQLETALTKIDVLEVDLYVTILELEDSQKPLKMSTQQLVPLSKNCSQTFLITV